MPQHSLPSPPALLAPVAPQARLQALGYLLDPNYFALCHMMLCSALSGSATPAHSLTSPLALLAPASPQACWIS